MNDFCCGIDKVDVTGKYFILEMRTRRRDEQSFNSMMSSLFHSVH